MIVKDPRRYAEGLKRSQESSPSHGALELSHHLVEVVGVRVASRVGVDVLHAVLLARSPHLADVVDLRVPVLVGVFKRPRDLAAVQSGVLLRSHYRISKAGRKVGGERLPPVSARHLVHEAVDEGSGHGLRCHALEERTLQSGVVVVVEDEILLGVQSRVDDVRLGVVRSLVAIGDHEPILGEILLALLGCSTG